LKKFRVISFSVILCLFVAAVRTVFSAESENLAKSLEHTRAVIAKHHLISLVEIEPLDEGEKTEFRYDRYPEVERLQSKSTSYARKKGKSWLKSDDWGETGAKVKPAKAKELDAMVSFPEAPLHNNLVAKDKSQGGFIVDLLEREPREKSERLTYEVRRANSTGFAYPKFVFDKSTDGPDGEALLVGYAGLMYSGEQKVKVNINYSYMFLVEARPAPTEGSDTRTPPISEKIYNFTELDLQKFDLKDKVVRLQIGPKIIQSEELGGSMVRAMVKDTAKPTAFYGMIDISHHGINKLGFEKGRKENVTLYLLVRPRMKGEVAQFIALGTRFVAEGDGEGVYSW